MAPATAGTINNISIGASTRGSGSFTSLTSNAATTFTANTGSTNSTSGTLVVTGGVGVSGNINAAGNITSSAGSLLGAFSSAYNASSETYNTAGFLTGFVQNGITYSLITYETVAGLGDVFGSTYTRVTAWREVDGTTGVTRNFTATYNSTTGRLATIAVA
jgi:hypothetical protein